MKDDDVQQGPKYNPLDPSQNKFGHQYGKPTVNGHATCGWCGCIENTKSSIQKCPAAYLASCGDGPIEWYRKSKYLPPDNKG